MNITIVGLGVIGGSFAGLLCTSIISPSAPTAIAAFANGSTKPRLPVACDGKQSIKPETFDEIMKTVKKYAKVEEKEIVL